MERDRPGQASGERQPRHRLQKAEGAGEGAGGTLGERGKGLEGLHSQGGGVAWGRHQTAPWKGLEQRGQSPHRDQGGGAEAGVGRW